MITDKMHQINKNSISSYEPRFFCDVYIAFAGLIVLRMLTIALCVLLVAFLGTLFSIVIYCNYTFWPALVTAMQEGKKLPHSNIMLIPTVVSWATAFIGTMTLGAGITHHGPPLYQSLKAKYCKPIPEGYFKEERP